MPQVGEYRPLLATTALVIGSGESLSAPVDLSGSTLVALQMPAAWTAADITFQGSHDGGTYADMYKNAGEEMTLSVDAGQYVIVSPSDFAGVRYLKLRSGNSSAAVNQGAERTITLLSRGV